MNTRLFTTWLVFGLLILGNVCHAEDAEDDDDDDDDVEVQIPKHVEAEDDTEYNAPAPSGPVHFLETFDKSWDSRWTITKDEDFKGEWVWTGGSVKGIAGDRGLVVDTKAAKHAVSCTFPEVLVSEAKPLVVQYEVRLQKGLECGGAYIKLLTQSDSFAPAAFSNADPYTIMFGPDKCGGTDKVHFIFRHKNPVSGVFEEKHMLTPPPIKTDALSHLYTLVVRPDNSFEILIDNASVKKGSLLHDFEPPVNPSKEIDDPEDKKPEDWVDDAKMADPEAAKPEDWDEDALPQIEDASAEKPAEWLDDAPATVADPAAAAPADWDAEEDGDWEAPQIPNPACSSGMCGEWKRPMVANPEFKGKWVAPQIDNPAYKGEWKARRIENPHYFVDEHPYRFSPMAAVGIEVWTMSDGILYDNIFIASDEAVARDFAEKTWRVRHAAEKEALPKPATAPSGPGLTEAFADAFENHPQLTVGVIGAMLLLVILLSWVICCSGRDEDDIPAALAHKKDDDAAGAKDDDEEGDDTLPAGRAARPSTEEVKEKLRPAAASGPAKRRARAD